MKGTADRARHEHRVLGRLALRRPLAGTATLRWGGTWTLEGALTARGINAAVFAPALLSEGRGEGTARFSMSGAEPARLAGRGRLEGTFTVHKGVLGSFDLSRARADRRPPGPGPHGVRRDAGPGALRQGRGALRNVTVAAGALNAGAHRRHRAERRALGAHRRRRRNRRTDAARHAQPRRHGAGSRR